MKLHYFLKHIDMVQSLTKLPWKKKVESPFLAIRKWVAIFSPTTIEIINLMATMTELDLSTITITTTIEGSIILSLRDSTIIIVQ